ncbi:MAG: hypothetical protein H8E46_06025 [FCB group bacterium]|nr:hypothetical protein [FCB group bacterium]
MIEVNTACSIVIVGGWNRKILTPPWLGKNIFKKDELELQFPLDPSLPLKVSDKESYTIDISNDKLMFQPLSLSDENLIIMAEAAKLVLEILPHTPVTAMGINFGFKEETPQTELLNYLDNVLVPSHREISDDKKCQAISIVKSYQLTGLLQNRVLNFKIHREVDEPAVIFDLNFHKEVDNAAVACEALRPETLLSVHSYSIDLLKNFNI